MAEDDIFDDDDAFDGDTDLNEPARTNATSGVLNTVVNRFRSFSRRTIILLGVGVGSIIGLSFLVAVFSGTSSDVPPDNSMTMSQQSPPSFNSNLIVEKKNKKRKKIRFKSLFKQLEQSQLSPILRELSYAGIEYNILQNGRQYDLEVDQDELNRAKDLLAIKGMPSGTARGYALFDEASNLGATEFDKRIRLIRALSGEMEAAIMEFDVVDYANVEIVIPEVRLFAATQPLVTASILIKRSNGAQITDETVYAILELVSNSVEGLDKSNISVVDTEGRVLSSGVVDRMDEKQMAQSSSQRTLIQGRVGKGSVVIPQVEDVMDWFQLKYNYETVLEKKAHNQLNGVLPTGAYKTAVTIDLNSVTNTGAPNIKRIIASVVVDEQFESVELSEATIEGITQAVAGAIGYVEGRDQIHVSKAAFLPKDDAGLNQTDGSDASDILLIEPNTMLDQLTYIMRYWPIVAIGSFATIACMVFGWCLLRLARGCKRLIQWLFGTFSKKPPLVSDAVPVLDGDATPTEPSPSLKDVSAQLQTKLPFSSLVQLRAITTQNPDGVAQVIQSWLVGNNE